MWTVVIGVCLTFEISKGNRYFRRGVTHICENVLIQAPGFQATPLFNYLVQWDLQEHSFQMGRIWLMDT